MPSASLKDQFTNVITYHHGRELWFTRPDMSFEETLEGLLDDLVMITESYKHGTGFKLYEWDEEDALSDNSDLPHRIGHKIRDIQDAKGWSLKKLAHAARLNPEYLQSVQRGESILGINALTNIAEALGVQTSALLPSNN